MCVCPMCVRQTKVIVTREDDFHTITADQIYEWWRDKVAVDSEHFDRITDGCLA